MGRILFSILIFSLQLQVWARSQKEHLDSEQSNEALPSQKCTQNIPKDDEKNIQEFLQKSATLRKNLDSGSTLKTQLNNLIDDYSKKISPSGLKALSAVYMREQFLQLANGLQNDPSINKAFKDFNTATEERISERKRYKDAGFFKRLSGDADNALINSGNTVTKKMNAFIASIKASSKIDPTYKEKMIKSLINMLMNENAADANIASAVADRYEGYTAIAKTVRNGAAGAGLMVGGLIVGGATVPAGATLIGSTTATLGTSGAATVGFLSSAAMGTAAGAAAGAGYGLLRGEAAMIAKSTLSDDSFMCSLVQEQTQHSQQVYKDALKFAAVGAIIGGGAGYLAAKGGIYALIAEGGGATLAAAGSVTSAWGATKEGLESKALFEKAAQASAEGDEVTARSLVKQAREKAVEAGLSGVDSVLAGVAAAKTTQSFKQSLKEAPQSIAQIAESQISNKVATELTNKGHEEWRKNYQDQMKAQGKPITEPREKPVPLQESEAAEAALSRLTNEGYKGLAVKNGKLVQDINRPANEIVPALNQKLNGGPAQDYAKSLVGKPAKTKDDIAKMADEVHEIWMKHNSWQKDQNPQLFKKYSQLTADEQIKDLNVVESVLKSQYKDNIPPQIQSALKSYRNQLLSSQTPEQIVSKLTPDEKRIIGKWFHGGSKGTYSMDLHQRTSIAQIAEKLPEETFTQKHLLRGLHFHSNQEYQKFVTSLKVGENYPSLPAESFTTNSVVASGLGWGERGVVVKYVGPARNLSSLKASLGMDNLKLGREGGEAEWIVTHSSRILKIVPKNNGGIEVYVQGQ